MQKGYWGPRHYGRGTSEFTHHPQKTVSVFTTLSGVWDRAPIGPKLPLWQVCVYYSSITNFSRTCANSAICGFPKFFYSSAPTEEIWMGWFLDKPPNSEESEWAVFLSGGTLGNYYTGSKVVGPLRLAHHTTYFSCKFVAPPKGLLGPSVSPPSPKAVSVGGSLSPIGWALTLQP